MPKKVTRLFSPKRYAKRSGSKATWWTKAHKPTAGGKYKRGKR